ncbi:MAG: inner membrane protein, partial [Pseudomonadota bacterium]
MSQQARFLLFVALSVAILTVWSTFFAPKTKPKLEEGPAAPVAVVPAPTPAPSPAVPPADAGASGEPVPPVETMTVETADWTARFSSEGAALESFVLKGGKQQRHGTAGGVEMVHPGEGQARPLSVEAAGLFGPKTTFRLVSRTADALVWERTLGGVTMTKTYRLNHEGYRLGLEVALRRTDGAPVTGDVKVVYPAFETAPKRSGLFSQGEVHQAACFFDGDRSMETRLYGTEDEPAKTFDRPAAFAALDEKFFLAALAPRQGAGSCVLSAPTEKSLEAALAVPLAPAAGASTAAFDLYLGPKETGRLQAFGHGTDVAIYNGSIAKAGKLLLPVLKGFHAATRNWGLAIILLTLLVKALTFPLAQKQMTSMEKMKALGPKLEAMKKQFEGDPQRQNVETMKLYKEHDISPV